MRRTGMQRRPKAIWALAAATMAALAMLVSPAGAAKVVTWDEHYEGSGPITNFCDSGLTVERGFVIDIRVHVVPRGRDGLEYYLQHGIWRETFTANGHTITSFANVTEKDHVVTDNGDGSLTIVILATGNATLYGEDGKAIARNPGQLRFILEIAADGTVTRGETVKGSTGRSDPSCGPALDALT